MNRDIKQFIAISGLADSEVAELICDKLLLQLGRLHAMPMTDYDVKANEELILLEKKLTKFYDFGFDMKTRTFKEDK